MEAKTVNKALKNEKIMPRSMENDQMDDFRNIKMKTNY